MADTLNVQNRDVRGKHRLRRLRASGVVPAVLYGHNEPAVSLSVDHAAIDAAVRHGAKMIELEGAVRESAIIREVQWDAFGHELIHVDFARVAADEAVEVTVPIELRGVAPGIKDGGIVQHLLHELRIECPAGKIPDRVEVSVNHLALNQTIRVADLVLDPSIQILEDGSATIAHCIEPIERAEEAVEIAEAAEPEVIGRAQPEEESV